jgi:glycosyltransferase involved in cell wall biosynthesis
MIANCLTPYRVHLHKRIAAGIPELSLHTLITHDDADFRWQLKVPDSIHLVHFGKKGDSPLASSFRNPRYEWQKGGRLIRFLRENRVAAVICSSYRYLSYLRVIAHCHRTGVPLFVNNDSNIRSERSLSPLAAWAKRRTYAWWLARVSGVMPMGRLGDEFFLKYGADTRRFYHVPYTPDYADFEQVDAERLDQFRGRYGLCRGRKYLLYSGRLVPVKRVDLLIDAFARLAEERPTWDVLIAGDGPLGEELRRRVPDRLCSRVVWTGFLEQEELKLAYHAADVLVLPSDREPWAVVVQEAMSAGLVVVASDVVGAAHELISDGESGRIVPSGDVDSLAKALREVTASDRLDRYKEQSARALAAWRESSDPVAEVRRALSDVGVLGR